VEVPHSPPAQQGKAGAWGAGCARAATSVPLQRLLQLLCAGGIMRVSLASLSSRPIRYSNLNARILKFPLKMKVFLENLKKLLSQIPFA
jgi:hypothetical protein